MDKKFIFGLIVGIGAGFTAGWFVAKNRLEKEYEEAYQWDRADMQENFEMKLRSELKAAGLNPDPRRKIRASEDGDPVVDGKVTVEKASFEQNKDYRKVVTNYNKPPLQEIATKYSEDDSSEDYEGDDEDPSEDSEEAETELDDEVVEAALRMSEVNNEDPYEITYDDFMDNKHYDKIDLYYYRSDDTVCGDDDVKIEEPEDLVGWDVFKTLERKSHAYARNEPLHTDYEIHTLSASYVETVQSRLETDKEREMRRLARKKDLMDESDYE